MQFNDLVEDINYENSKIVFLLQKFINKNEKKKAKANNQKNSTNISHVIDFI